MGNSFALYTSPFHLYLSIWFYCLTASLQRKFLGNQTFSPNPSSPPAIHFQSSGRVLHYSSYNQPAGNQMPQRTRNGRIQVALWDWNIYPAVLLRFIGSFKKNTTLPRERTNISHQTGSSKNHHLQKCWLVGDTDTVDGRRKIPNNQGFQLPNSTGAAPEIFQGRSRLGVVILGGFSLRFVKLVGVLNGV